MSTTFEERRKSAPDHRNANQLSKFLSELIATGKTKRQARKAYLALVRGRHFLHRKHFGTFRPVKPLSF